MISKYGGGVLALFFLSFGSGSSQQNANIYSHKINLTLYFEGLCPDSQMFYLDQLQPAYKNFSDYLIIDLVPYGKATTFQKGPNQWDFRCQHGSKECLLNKMMACGNAMLKGNQDAQVQFDGCVMDSSTRALDYPAYCADKSGLDPAKLTNCTYSDVGSYILNKMGKLTPRRIGFVPRIDVDGTYRPEDQNLILRDLAKFVCDRLSYGPEKCYGVKLSAKTTRWCDFLFSG